ncbi:hypothetical protein A0H81_11587 [Grifola frondosa]|uniref:DUF4246 domain-containing protein n=1 Tax=Grifola frondosa TaxID=5627 RepID=A0A1C7LVS1_GRIFR|nr:hypothetical protein A0H81_11587 [Grifola frondosa]
MEEHGGGDKRFDPGSGEKRWPRNKITPAQLGYVFKQLKYAARCRDAEIGIEATAIARAYQCMTLIPPEFKADLRTGAKALESIPSEQQDWHPGFNNQVLDLVHPSLYCFRIGKSLWYRPPAVQESLVPLRIWICTNTITGAQT